MIDLIVSVAFFVLEADGMAGPDITGSAVRITPRYVTCSWKIFACKGFLNTNFTCCRFVMLNQIFGNSCFMFAEIQYAILDIF